MEKLEIEVKHAKINATDILTPDKWGAGETVLQKSSETSATVPLTHAAVVSYKKFFFI